MAKKKKAESLTKPCAYEKYEVVEINRQQIKNAPYNPRVISNEAKKKLRANFREVGLLSPIVWNVRTGNIVAGHQRIDALDTLEKTFDYTMKVARVDLDEKTEKQQNVFMNNPEAQGDFDIEKLEVMAKDAELSMEKMGFQAADMYRLFGVDSLDSDEMAKVSNRLHAMRDAYDNITKRNEDKNDVNFYLVVVFKNYEERAAFTEKFGFDDNRYLDGKVLREKMEGEEE